MRLQKKARSGNSPEPGRRITVFPSPGELHRGVLRCGALQLPCALGRSGVTHMKREGDGATPAGRLRVNFLYARRDRLPGPATALSVRAMRPNDGWCEDPRHGRYNCPIRLPSSAGHETMWRDDPLYDVVGVLDWNLSPRVRRLGSAIFLHLCRPNFGPTAGCVALRRADLLRLLRVAGPRPEILVAAKPRKAGRRPPKRR